MIQPSFTVTPATTGFAKFTEFTFTNTTQTTATLQKLVWDLGDESQLIYDTNSITYTYPYPGTFTVRLTATDSEDNSDSYIQNIDINTLYRDYILFTQIPENYTSPGKKTDIPFRVRVVSAEISATELNLDLYAINSKSIPEQFVSPRWTFLNPTWKFLDKNNKTIYSLNVPVTPIFYENKIVAVSGEEEFYFVDSQSVGNPETNCPILITCTLQTSGFVNSKDSIIYPYKSYSNNATVKCATIWHVNNYTPDLLKITSNYLDEIHSDYWENIKIPFIVSAHASRGLKIPGADETISEIIFTHPQSDIKNNETVVNLNLTNCISSDYILDEGPLYFQATDNNDLITGGYIFTTITPNVTAKQTSLTAQTTIDNKILYRDDVFPDIHTLAPNSFVWVANPARGALNKITLIPHPENCPVINTFKQNEIFIDGSVKELQTSVPLTEGDSTYNYYLTGFSGIYGLAIDPRHYELLAADADLGCIYKFSTTGKLLSTLTLSSLDGKLPVNESSAPASISLDQDYNVWVSLFNAVSVLKYDKDFNLLFTTAPTGNQTLFYITTTNTILNSITNVTSSVLLLTADIDSFLQNLSSITPTLSTNVTYLTSTYDSGNTFIVNYTIALDNQPLTVNSIQVSSALINTFINDLSANITPTYKIRYTADALSAYIDYVTLLQTEPLSTSFIANLSTLTQLYSAYTITDNNDLTYTIQYNTFPIPNYGVPSISGAITPFFAPLTTSSVLSSQLQDFIQNLNTISPYPYNYSYISNNNQTVNIQYSILSSIKQSILNSTFDGDFLLKPPVVETDQNNDCWCTYAHPLCSLLVKYSSTGEPKTQINLPQYAVPVSLAIAINNDIWVSNSYNVLSASGSIQRYTDQSTTASYLSTGIAIPTNLSGAYVANLSSLPGYYDSSWYFTQYYGTSTLGFSAVDITFILQTNTKAGDYTLVTNLTGIPRPSYLAVDRNNNLWFTYGLRNIGCYNPYTKLLYKWFVVPGSTQTPFSILEAPLLSSESAPSINEQIYNYDVYANDEEIGGLAVDAYNRIWVIDSYYNKAFVIHQYNLNDLTLNTRTFKIKPDTTIGYWPDFITGATITDNLTGVKSAQAAGDWTGYKWYQKYITPKNYSTTKTIAGSSLLFNINPFENPYQFRKVNDSFNATEYYKSLALPENLQSYTTLWDKFFPGLVGTGEESTYDDLGQISYERIANFSENHRDLDTCNISQLLSLAEETKVNYSDYSTRLPTDILKTMDAMSISLSRLLGIKNNYPNLLASLSGELDTTTSYVTAGQKIILKSKYKNTISLQSVPALYNNISVYPVASLTALPGYPQPLTKYYQLFEYNPQYDDYFIENVIDWDSPHTLLTPNLSTVDDWYEDHGIVETTFNYLLNKNLFYK
jgi:hypothetical protein